MEAIIYTQYGSPDVLQLKEIEKPTPGEHEVLVKVHAASVNSWDWDLVRGKPYLSRLFFGIRKPKFPVIGSDIAGVVESVGPGVKDLKVGDAVFGDISGHGFGAFAEYATAPADVLAKKPQKMSYAQAASLSQAAVLAWQGLFKEGKLAAGEHILINGAGGGVGTFAIQMAKHTGAEVTAVDRRDKFELMKSLGADHLIDYQQEDFTNSGPFDLIYDVVAKRSLPEYRKALRPGGRFVMAGGAISTIFQLLFMGKWYARDEQKSFALLMHQPNKNDLEELAALFEDGALHPVIDHIYPLEETGKAVQYLGNGHVKGNLIISLLK